MKKLIAIFLVFISASAFAQEPVYGSAIGLKFSGPVAATYKKFVKHTNAIEAQFASYNEGVRVVGLYEFHFFDFEEVPGLSWYVGPGAHVGVWRNTFRNKYNSTFDIGVDGVVGLDYKIKNAPVNISLDWQPGFSILGSAGFAPQFGGIAIRYVLP